MSIDKIDRRDHSPAVKARPIRDHTTAIIIHHLGVDVDKDGISTVDDAIHFFTKDPEGVATVCLGGSYKSKIFTIDRWRDEGIPAIYQGRGFVPYHFLVDRRGIIYRMLDLEALGAHAGNWNDRSVAVCFLGDFSKEPPNEVELHAGVLLLGDIRDVHAAAEILSHDECMMRDGLPPKGCPGAKFPLDDVRKSVREPKN